jgi:large subunit ribosomal protein L28
MSKICAITGKRPVTGGRIIHKGVSKKAGGIGLQLVKNNKRVFRPNLQRVRVKLPSGQVKRIWVSVKAIKAGKIEKAKYTILFLFRSAWITKLFSTTGTLMN